MDKRNDSFAGDEFMRLYLTHEYRIRGYVRCLVKHYADVDDVMQNAVAIMWKKRRSLEDPERFLPWALTIARYEVLKHFDRKRNRCKCLSPELFEMIEAKALTAVDEADRRQEALQECVGRLSQRDQELLRLRYQIQQTTRTVAESLGRGIDAVYKALNRIHQRLLQCIRCKLAQEEMR